VCTFITLSLVNLSRPPVGLNFSVGLENVENCRCFTGGMAMTYRGFMVLLDMWMDAFGIRNTIPVRGGDLWSTSMCDTG